MTRAVPLAVRVRWALDPGEWVRVALVGPPARAADPGQGAPAPATLGGVEDGLVAATLVSTRAPPAVNGPTRSESSRTGAAEADSDWRPRKDSLIECSRWQRAWPAGPVVRVVGGPGETHSVADHCQFPRCVGPAGLKVRAHPGCLARRVPARSRAHNVVAADRCKAQRPAGLAGVGGTAPGPPRRPGACQCRG